MAELTEKQIEDIIKSAETRLGGARVQVYQEIWSNLVPTASTNTKNFSRVDSTRIRIVTHIAALNNTSSPTFIRLSHYDGGQLAHDKIGVAPLIGETVNWDGFMLLGGGDYTQIVWTGCTSGDDLYAVVSGYEILL